MRKSLQAASWLLAVQIVLYTGAFGPTPLATPTATDSTTGSNDLLLRGQSLYAEHCAACHGARGDGRGKVAAELLTKLEAEYAAVCEAFSEELHAGKRG